MTGWDSIWNELCLILSDYDLDKTILIYGDANVEQNYINWCKANKQKRVFGKCIYRPYTLLQRTLDYHMGILHAPYMDGIYIQSKPNMSFKPKHFICMNAVAKPHRFEMINLIFEYDWQHKGHISWLNRRDSIKYVDGMQTKFFQGQMLTLDYDGTQIDASNNQLTLPLQYREACFDIVNESTVSDISLFITEKTWKPILQKTPFIILGSKNSHKHLEEYFGIKPYTDLFDYRFDNLDYEERFASIKHDNLERLLNMDIHELNEIVNSDKMQELLEYNKVQLLTHSIHGSRDKRLQGLSNTMIIDKFL